MALQREESRTDSAIQYNLSSFGYISLSKTLPKYSISRPYNKEIGRFSEWRYTSTRGTVYLNKTCNYDSSFKKNKYGMMELI
jgi:hypothetical protein